MTPITQPLDLAPDVVDLARRLPAERGTSLLWSADGRAPSYLAHRPIAVAHGLDPEPTLLIGAPAAGSSWAFPRWMGVLPYEAFRDLERPGWKSGPERRAAPAHQDPIWFRYAAVLRIDDQVTVIGETRAAVDQLVRDLQQQGGSSQPVHLRRLGRGSDDAHVRRIERAQQLILEGDLYLVNLARRLDFAMQGDDLDLLQRMAEQSRPAFGAFLQLGETSVCSTSPELFLRLGADRSVLTSPIKGTRPRDPDRTRDQATARELASDPKERAELAMVIDVERNDLGSVAQTGSVRVVGEPRVVPCGGVWHRMADVTAQLDIKHDRAALLRAMTPSGSVTGAPKVRAMEVIAELEADRRGLYTGALGYVAHDGSMTLSMAIRTLVLGRGSRNLEREASYFAGGGIVVDADPRQELQETEWKAQQLLALCDDKT